MENQLGKKAEMTWNLGNMGLIRIIASDARSFPRQQQLPQWVEGVIIAPSQGLFQTRNGPACSKPVIHPLAILEKGLWLVVEVLGFRVRVYGLAFKP